jgi:hypothetical protein
MENQEVIEWAECINEPGTICLADTPIEGIQQIQDIRDRFKDDAPVAGIGLTIMLVLAVVRKAGLLNKVPKKYYPYVACGLALLVYVATGMANSVPARDIAYMTITTGATAVGFWELLIKPMSRRMDRKQNE